MGRGASCIFNPVKSFTVGAAQAVLNPPGFSPARRAFQAESCCINVLTSPQSDVLIEAGFFSQILSRHVTWTFGLWRRLVQILAHKSDSWVRARVCNKELIWPLDRPG